MHHCNALQHTATHCNTLQRTATHCNTLQHTAGAEVTVKNLVVSNAGWALVAVSSEEADDEFVRMRGYQVRLHAYVCEHVCEHVYRDVIIYTYISICIYIYIQICIYI